MNAPGQKFDQEKPRWDLVPWAAVETIAHVMTYGAKKYAPNSWQNVPEGKRRYYAAALRHLVAWWGGQKLDPESGHPHLGHAACCVLFLCALDQQAEAEKQGGARE